MSEEATLDEFIRGNPEKNSESEWDESKLEDLLSELLTGGRPTGGGLDEGEYISIGGTQVNSEGYIDLHDLVYIPEDYFEKVKETQLQKHDILVVKDGANTGDVAIAWESDDRVVTNEHLFTLRADPHINSPYLFYFLLSHQGWKQINGTITGSAQEGINRGFTGKVDVQYPPRPEQRKIATVLYTVDRAIEKTEKTISQLKRVKQGLYQTLFSEGYHQHDQFKSSKYGQIPEVWGISKLSEVASQIQAGGTPDTDVPEYYGGDIPWVKTGELSQYRVTKTEQTITEKGLEESTARLFSPRTILIAMYGATTGEVSLLDIEATTNQACCGVVTTDKMKPEFLFHQLNYLSTRLESLSAGSGQQNISKGIIEKFDVLVPSVEEQESIACALNTVDTSIDENNTTKNQYQHLKRGLMQDLLSGKVRTTDTNIEVPEEIAKYG